MNSSDRTKFVVYMGTIAIMLIVLVVTSKTQVVDTSKVRRELLVYFKPGIIITPDGRTGGILE